MTHQSLFFKKIEMIKKKEPSADRTPKAQAAKVKIHKLDYIKIKRVYISKDTINRRKRCLQNGKK